MGRTRRHRVAKLVRGISGISPAGISLGSYRVIVDVQGRGRSDRVPVAGRLIRGYAPDGDRRRHGNLIADELGAQPDHVLAGVAVAVALGVEEIGRARGRLGKTGVVRPALI